MAEPHIPKYHELMWPALRAVKALGGSATVQEIDETTVEAEGFSEEQQAVRHGDGRMSELKYRLHWARTHLKGIGALENSSRGVWALTDHGRSLTSEQTHAETKAWRAEKRATGLARRTAEAVDAPETDEEAAELSMHTASLSWLYGARLASKNIPGRPDTVCRLYLPRVGG